MRAARLDVGPDLRDHVARIAGDIVLVRRSRIAHDREAKRGAVGDRGVGLRDVRVTARTAVVGAFRASARGERDHDDEYGTHQKIWTSEFTPAPANEIG